MGGLSSAPTHPPLHGSQAEELQAALDVKSGEVAALEARLGEGLSEAQAATISELRQDLAAERKKAEDQAALVRTCPLPLLCTCRMRHKTWNGHGDGWGEDAVFLAKYPRTRLLLCTCRPSSCEEPSC